MALSMLPAQKRPCRSQRPSFRRLSAPSVSMSWMVSTAPVSGSKKRKPPKKATAMPPRSRSTSAPGCSSTGTCVYSPVPGVNQLIDWPLMSSQ